ncbi:glutathione S-transferase family protein [Sediminicoccus rosea]|jgi:putative glutathione S-transferase|uniref:Glutathione S-transferase family protein n=1 Tax=Sediminicoccus rosea TaxID=1225128 RepID=A0ABZ0PLY5_9PROT|nr:glutathione S-transferase family protein [Sediminicoccus rosea]WPB86748.1 glutathione S-transferase family protein [Sediminicoccus rosea]
MGLLLHGAWTSEEPPPASAGGAFIRRESQFRNWITPDGAPGPGGEGGFAAEAGRYHLYVSLACPWAHRALIFRTLKGLEGMISVSVTHWLMGEQGWGFSPAPGVVPDPVRGAAHLHELYSAAEPSYTGRVTVPVLWDKARGRIVNNESAEIIRMLNSAFDGIGARPGDFYPRALRPEIDALNARIYAAVNNGVYQAGFARSQAAYDAAIGPLFEMLGELEARLSRSRYLLGGQVTEADWRLFTTLVRFDAVYVGHFRCDRRRILDHPNLWGWLRELYQWPGVAATVDFDHIRRHYYLSHRQLNPGGILPVGPELDFTAPHGREALG